MLYLFGLNSNIWVCPRVKKKLGSPLPLSDDVINLQHLTLCFIGIYTESSESFVIHEQSPKCVPLLSTFVIVCPQKILHRGIYSHILFFHFRKENLLLLEWNESISFLQEWNGHSIPVGMKCSLHSSRNEMLTPFQQELYVIIPFHQEWG